MRVTILASMLLASGSPVEAVAPDPATVSRTIALKGPGAAINALNAHHEWDAALDRIGSGDDRWLALAAQLRQGSDAGTSEAIDSALSEAIARNPAGVLRTFGRGVRATEVCHDRAIEPTPGQVRAFAQTTQRALRGVADPALGPARDACLAALDAL